MILGGGAFGGDQMWSPHEWGQHPNKRDPESALSLQTYKDVRIQQSLTWKRDLTRPQSCWQPEL